MQVIDIKQLPKNIPICYRADRAPKEIEGGGVMDMSVIAILIQDRVYQPVEFVDEPVEFIDMKTGEIVQVIWG